MKTLINEIKSANQDISFVKVMSVYAYLIIGSASMLIGLVIGRAF